MATYTSSDPVDGYDGELSPDNSNRVHDAFEETPIREEYGSTLEDLNSAFVDQLDRISGDIRDVARSHNVDTAKEQDLDKFGLFVGVERQDGESDDTYRQRIKIRGRAKIASGTTDEMMELSAVAFETTVDELSFPVDLAANPAQFDVEVPSSIATDAALTVSDAETALEYALPAGHRINITTV